MTQKEGNETMKKKLLGQPEKKRFFIKKCMEIYTDALIQNAQCFETRAKILSNRALLQMYLKNYRKAVEDCLEAIKLDPKFIRPYCRACECLLNLGMYEKCLKLADKGLAVDYMKEIKDIRDEALKKLEEETAKTKEKQTKVKEENSKLLDKCRELGVVLGAVSDYPLPQVYNVAARDNSEDSSKSRMNCFSRSFSSTQSLASLTTSRRWRQTKQFGAPSTRSSIRDCHGTTRNSTSRGKTSSSP